MGYTNKTSHYDLPQWIAGDKPSWLGDVNTAMLNIDTAIAGADASATAAESSAAAANAQVQAQEPKIAKNTTDIQALTENLAATQGEVNNAKTVAEEAKNLATGLSPLRANFVDVNKGISITVISIGNLLSVSGYVISPNAYTDSTKVVELEGNPLNLNNGAILTIGGSGFNITTPPTNYSSQAVCGLTYTGGKTALYLGKIAVNQFYVYNGNILI